MSETSGKKLSSHRLRHQHLSEALERGALKQVTRILNQGMDPSDIAHLLESSPPAQRGLLWSLLDRDQGSEVLQYLSDDIRGEFLRTLNTDEVLSVIEDFEPDDLVDLLQQLPEQVIQDVLGAMNAADRARIEAILAYPEDTAGGLMNTDVVTVRPDVTLAVVLRYLRRHEELPAGTDSLLVVNRQNEFIGILPINRMLVAHPGDTVREIMDTGIEPIPVDMPDTAVANLFQRHDLISAPVISADGRLLGRITIDDVVDVIRDDADHKLMSMAGLDEEEDTFAPLLKTTRRRAVWLGINLITAFIASAVIGLFEETIDQVVALAILMPIVASMGGVAGSQALTLVIRGMAVGQIGRDNIAWLINRECMVGFMNGLLWALIVSAAAVLWFRDLTIGLVIAAAMVINLIAAAVAGTALPLLLKARNIDPALAGGVILTTVTDVVGFMSFLGLATLAYQ